MTGKDGPLRARAGRAALAAGVTILLVALLVWGVRANRPDRASPAGTPAGAVEAPATRGGAGTPDGSTPASPEGNLLENPGFEKGEAGWLEFEGNPNWGAYEIVSRPVRSGSRAVHLPVEWPEGEPGPKTRVFGVYQELKPERFPEVISGYYRVESWSKDSEETDLYAQVVIMAWGDPRTSELVSPGKPIPGLRNYQVRYYLAGVTEPPFLLGNARVKFVRKGPPEKGGWVYFELPVRQDFLELWGVVPENFDSLRVLFEARWDNKPSLSGIHADVYYDDLFVGGAGP